MRFAAGLIATLPGRPYRAAKARTMRAANETTMPEAKPETTAEYSAVIGKATGVSLALVVVIIGGITANLSMMWALRESVSVFGNNLKNTSDDVGDIKNSVKELTQSTRSELSMLRDRVTKIETVLEKIR